MQGIFVSIGVFTVNGGVSGDASCALISMMIVMHKVNELVFKRRHHFIHLALFVLVQFSQFKRIS